MYTRSPGGATYCERRVEAAEAVRCVVVVVTEMIDVECASDCASDVDSGCDDDGHLS